MLSPLKKRDSNDSPFDVKFVVWFSFKITTKLVWNIVEFIPRYCSMVRVLYVLYSSPCVTLVPIG